MRRFANNLLKIWGEIENVFLLAPILYIPGGLGNRLRYWFYKRRMKYLGRNVILDVGVQISNPEFISIGDNTWIDKFVILLAGPPRRTRKTYYKRNKNYPGEEGEIYIGKSCHIAPFTEISGHGGVWLGNHLGLATGSRIFSLSHHYRDLSAPGDSRKNYIYSPRVEDSEQAMISGPVVMQDRTALGANSVILPGITIYESSWVAAMSSVTADVEACVVVGGNPAQVIKQK